VYSGNGIGPRVYPYGTLQLMTAGVDLDAPLRTDCTRLSRKDVNHVITGSPRWYSSSSSSSGGGVQTPEQNVVVDGFEGG
jgi:hypothetical protein